jgi:hypothetical protein
MSRAEELLQKLAKTWERMQHKEIRGKHRMKQGGKPICM